jgi:exopolysaccharide production protein ExoQ
MNSPTTKSRMKTATSTLEIPAAVARTGMLLPATVGFFFSSRLFSVLLAVHVMHTDPQVGVMMSLALNFLLLAVVLFQSIGSAPRTLRSILQLPCFFWISLFLGFSGCSLIWSAAISLSAAAAFWCAMAADLAMVILLLRIGSIPEMATGVMKGYVYGACCIAIASWAMPRQADLRLGDDEFLGPNQIGYLCAFAVFFAQYLMRANPLRLRWKLCAIFLAITLLRSLSKTTIAAFLVGEAVVLFLDKSISRKTRTMIIVGLLLVIGAFSGLLASYFDVYSNAGNQAETLTGRLGIWAYFLNEAFNQPWIGHGFHSAWKVIPPFGIDQFEARHAHNELLQQFYAYGIVGIVMLIGLYRSFFRRVKKLPPSPLKALLFGLLVFALVRGLTDTEAFDLSLPLWAIAMLSAVIAESRNGEWPMPRQNTALGKP